MGWVVLGEGLGLFMGATSEGRMSVRLMTTRAEFPEHPTSVSYFREFRILTSGLKISATDSSLTDLCACWFFINL
jgi:hypothetical protein